jgi:tetratricopeptide (TPR) repeat protein
MLQPLEPFSLPNEATYDGLISLIENSQGLLSLIVVACDDLRLRQRVIERYEAEARTAKIRAYRVVLGAEPSLRSGLAELSLRQGEAAVITVTGAEWLLRMKLRAGEEQSDLDKFFGYLQWTREGLREFRSPIVLWVTQRILREMSRKAPDFWSWRKAVLRFAAEETAEIAVRVDQRSPSVQPSSEFLPPLEEVLAEIQQWESTAPESVHLATLYDQLGQVCADRIATGQAADLDRERQQTIDAFQNSIHRYREINNQSALVGTLNRFGNFLFAQSRYEDAIELHQQSLEIACDIGDRSGEATSLSNLGNAYQLLGQYPRAIEFYQQSLEIARDIGDRNGEANSLGSLGNAYNSLGRYPRAIELYQQSLEMMRDIGDRNGEAQSIFSKALSLAKFEPRRFEAITTLRQARAIYAELQLEHKVESCDKAIRGFSQIIATEQHQSAPVLPTTPTINKAPPQDDCLPTP